ncbi:hypothetical protein FHS55_001767 [Angulomicrobium tetraedrale]|uniref:EF-hand domain-containing protein n=1 Tax=Ancylobacter tetraedralis TaxID=217068 RepID=A0A839Z945_9HYPH|nr:hypothetical protein [Ancylobacter tetraedralis]MBB3771168.1 hypothetical protein [Ancylobacter tetraedralis]
MKRPVPPSARRRPAPRLALAALILASLPLLAPGAQAQAPSPAKLCADRWNEMKAKGQTGDQTYRDFAQTCMAQVNQGDAKPDAGGSAPPPGASSAHPPSTGGQRPPTGPAAAAAQPSMKQCADLWNEMKTKNQTGRLTYREFAQQCLAGSPGAEQQPPEAARTRSSVPSVGTRPAATPAPAPPPALQQPPGENDRAALERCNGEWQAYKARYNLSGAKAWHVFMARCLP